MYNDSATLAVLEQVLFGITGTVTEKELVSFFNVRLLLVIAAEHLQLWQNIS